jgi:polysaccharide export outer membrane protein
MHRLRAALLTAAVTLSSGGMLRAQQAATDSRDTYAQRTRAIDQSESRAEKEAERMVSLPPEKIILLLTQEPGLFLEVKKLLVRKAYSDGQILDPNALTDDAVFRLVRENEETRALITQQIVDRGYIRAKPTKEELARQFEQQQKLARVTSEEEGGSEYPEGEDTGSRQSWGRQQNGRYYNAPGTSTPQSRPLNPSSPVIDQRRALLQANAGANSQTDASGLPLDALGQQTSPEDLQRLISTYGAGQSAGTGQLDLTKLSAAQLGSGASGADAAQSQSQEEAFNRTQDALTTQRPLMGASYSDLVPGRDFRRPQRREKDQPALLRRPNPYADVPSLYELYSQYSQKPAQLRRFGIGIFESGTGNLDQLPMDLPAGPDYVLGPGDGLNINLWGSVSQRLHRVVDREGLLSLPEIGSLQVSGRTIADTQHMVQVALRSQYKSLDADISLDKLRTVRIYVVGDVTRPGAYDVSSLSTPLNALYEAGGPTAKGSMRIVKHYRGNQLVENVDLYDLLLHGVQSSMARLESGDTILVPPIGREITIQGMVRRPAIYELNGEKSLAEALELAGGVLSSGTLRHVDVDRVQAHEDRSMLRLDIPENNDSQSVTAALEQFQIQDGDKINISPIVAFSQKTVYLDGHVSRPGKYAFRDGMKVTDLVHGYPDLLPEPYKQHAEIIRLNAPDYQPQIIAFNLADALDGKDQDLVLKPFDTLRIFSRFDFEDQPVVTVSGEVRDPGDHVTNGATYLRDAIFLAGNASADAELNDVQVFRKLPNGKLEVLNANLAKALNGDVQENILLQPQDRVFVHKDPMRIDPPSVEVQGEVPRPGKYPLGTEMTASELVKLAGGLKRSAYTQEAELTRYSVEQGKRVEAEHIPVAIAAAVSGEADTDVRLHPGDVLTIRQISGWKDIGATVKLEGEVVHPGTYGVQEGERLSDVIARAGGFRDDAYPYGAIFERLQVRELEEKNRAQLILQAKQEGGALGAGVDDPMAKEASLTQWHDTLAKLQTTPPVGRMVIHIASGKSWVHSPSDIQLRGGDALFIPKKPNFVMVQGAVYNPTGISFRSGKSARWYLRQAGGPTSAGDKKNIFIVRANGAVNGGSSGLLNGGVLDSAMQPGDMIVVPSKAFGGGFKWRETLQVAQLVSAIGIAVQVAKGF